jgi:hypothetical protein
MANCTPQSATQTVDGETTVTESPGLSIASPVLVGGGRRKRVQAQQLSSVEVHGKKWYDDPQACRTWVGAQVPSKAWVFTSVTGDKFGQGSDTNNTLSRLDYFFFGFPKEHLPEIVRLTNIELESNRLKTTTCGEVLKYFGVLLLATQFEFSSRATLWQTVSLHPYIPAPNFGKTGMPQHRFDAIHRYIRFADQPKQRPSSMSSETYRWKLVDNFVGSFNKNRSRWFTPSDRICVDESISRWYGQGGTWINHALPMYVSIDRKPEDGCEIQSCCCGESGIMIRLRLVKSSGEEASEDEEETGVLHGTQVLRSLVLPWSNSNRIICGDSYFASVGACEEMNRIGLQFIGVVKQATKRFPMGYLSNLELSNRGDFKGLVSKKEDGTTDFLSFVWMDRDRRYFVSTTASLKPGRPYSRTRWRQVDPTPNALPEKVELTVPQPLAAEIYYNTCGKVDQHNRH